MIALVRRGRGRVAGVPCPVAPAVLALLLAAAPSGALAGRVPGPGETPGDPHDDGLATIDEREVLEHLWRLASPELEGRDTPSVGLSRAGDYIASVLRAAGLEALQGGDYRITFERTLPAPVADECSLRLDVEDGEPRGFAFGEEFVPLAYCNGSVSGPLVFLGYGINAQSEKFMEVTGKGLKGKVAMIVEGEPRHRRKFDGPELTRYATVWNKLEDLAQAGVAGVIHVRRPPDVERMRGAPELDPPQLGFRHTFATWSGERMIQPPNGLPADRPPVVEVTMAVAGEILGEDVEVLVTKIDKGGKPVDREPKGRRVELSAESRDVAVPIDNLAGVLRGTDEGLAEEYVVLGAHYDHVGVDDRGRIGFGADDNASGTAGLLELAQAFAAAPPRRPLVFAFFAGEEDNLLGSKDFVRRAPISMDRVVAMVNLDMLGRGDRDEVAVLGIAENPGLERVLERARKLSRTGVKKITVRQGQELFERSDHFSFHEAGVPVLFFFEGLPISRNTDYHTWRDEIARIDLEKIENTTRLVFNTAWLLANDDARPDRPRD